MILKCGGCSQEVNPPRNLLGHEFPCPSCGEAVEIPIDPNSRPEETLYSDENVKITSRRVMADGSTYRLRYVGDVRMERERPYWVFALCLLIAGAVAVILGICVVAIFKVDAGYNLISIGGLMIGVAGFLTLGFRHVVVVVIDNEEKIVMGGKDRDYVSKICGKIKRAVSLHQRKTLSAHTGRVTSRVTGRVTARVTSRVTSRVHTGRIQTKRD